MRKIMIISLILSALSLPVYAQSGIAAATQAKIVAPFIDDQTFAIVRIDPQRINAEEVFDKIIEVIQLPPEDKLYGNLQSAKKIASQWVADFTDAGGRDIYIVFSMTDFPGFFCLVPITENTNIATLADLLRHGQPAGTSKNSPIYWDTFQRMGNVFFGGADETFKRLQSAKPHPRPELAVAFAAAGEGAVSALVLPSSDQRRVIEEVLPILPEQVGGGSSKVVTQGVRWVALGINGPPKMSLTFTLQSPETASATVVNKSIANFYETLRQVPQVRQIVPNIDAILAKFTPVVEGNQVVLALDDRTIDTLITKDAATIFARAREGAKRVQCTSNLRAIARAIVMHQGEYKDQLPATLETLIETEKLPPLSLVCPGTEDQVGEVSYVYRGSDKYHPFVEDMILVHDKLGNHPDGFVNVLFVNASVKTMSEKEFLQAIDQDNKLRREKGLPEIPIIK